MSAALFEVREITSLSAWLSWREKDVTASRLPALFDLHPYMSRDDLAATMRGTSGSGAGALPADNPAMRRGRIWEPAVAAAIGEERPTWHLTKATTYHRLPWLRLGCTPDYWVIDSANEQAGQGLIQIKTTAPSVWEKWRGRPPVAYLIQTLTELIATDRAWGWLVIMVMSPSYPIYFFPVARNPKAEDRILKGVADWWRDWDKGLIAPAAPSAELVAELDDGSSVDLSQNNYLCQALPERDRLKAEVSAAQKRIAEIDMALKAAMGAASNGWLPGFNISFKSHTRRETVLPERVVRTLRVMAAGEDDDAA